MTRFVAAIVGVGLIVTGWNAWTGRFRYWAHRASGYGYIPLLLVPLGVGVIGIGIAGGGEGEMSTWVAIAVLPAVLPAFLALLLFLLNIFQGAKRWPGGLRPRWLPPDAPVPECTAPARTWKPWNMSPDSSGSVATGGLPGRGRRRAHWAVFALDEGSHVPYLTGGMRGVRWCRVDVYQEGVAIYQQYSEDRLYDDRFALVLRRGDVESVEYVPGRRPSWRAIVNPEPLHLPKLIFHSVAGRTPPLAVRDPRFRRDARRSLDLLATTLGVSAIR